MDCFSRYAPPPDFSEWIQFAIKWTPRAIVAGLAGYYCLGVAYEMGIMAAIDRMAIRILRPSLGYMGIAAIMPTFQWYSAWGVRVVAAITAGILYDLTARIAYAAWTSIPFPSKQEETFLYPATLYRHSHHMSPSHLS